METCIYKGIQICAYDVVNDNMAMNYKLDKEWKLAGKDGELICEECGEELIFKARDIRKRVPHFAHKSSNRNCYYSSESIKESENHKKGKLILYKYFKKRYPEENIRINHRFSFNRRADVYIEFKSGDKLAVEYQRSELDIRDWEEKDRDYSKIGINTLWFMRGDMDNLTSKERQIELSFFQRAMLNEKDKTAIYLDVDRYKIILGRNLRYSHPDGFKKDREELFIREYELDEIHIDSRGKIECEFTQEFELEQEEFIERFKEKVMDRKKLYAKVGKKETQFEQIGFDFFEDSEVNESNPKIEELPKDKEGIIQELCWDFHEENSAEEMNDKVEEIEKPVHPKIEVKYGKVLNRNISFGNNLLKACSGDENGKKALIRYFIYYANSDDMKVLKFICMYYHVYGKCDGVKLYREIMKGIGFEERLKIQEKSVKEFRCPMCGSSLEETDNRGGKSVNCSREPECKLHFYL